ncbi:MAG: YtxH domain-containing protein [Bacteroidales bacterium]|nr:YtxH domain-containing protein [Bacteroidales bacterium]
MNSGKVFFGILAGLAAGAMLGLLFAPEKGSNTIKKITEKGDDFMDDLDQKFDRFLDIINQKMDQVSKDISTIAKHD